MNRSIPSIYLHGNPGQPSAIIVPWITVQMQTSCTRDVCLIFSTNQDTSFSDKSVEVGPLVS